MMMALTELLRIADADPGVDVVREGVKVLAEAIMDLEVEQHVGAGWHEWSPERSGYRNGVRERRCNTRVGTMALRVPRVRDGRHFPALLEPRTRAEWALVVVVQEAYIAGVSTRRVDDLGDALGVEGISTSPVSRLCQELPAEVKRVRSRPLPAAYPYLGAALLGGAGSAAVSTPCTTR
jgi:transposase-like protein